MVLTATDSVGVATSQSFTITVNNTNDAPTVANIIPDQTIAEDIPSSNNPFFQIPLNRFNDVDAGDTLTYTLTKADGSSLPSWISMSSDRWITANPTNSEVGTIALKATATDSSGASVSDTFNITVTNTNDAPTVANAIADQTTAEDASFSYQVPSNAFADVDSGTTLTYTATLSNGSSLPSWLSFNASTRTFSGTPTNSEVGTIAVKVTASDRFRYCFRYFQYHCHQHK